MQKLIFLIKLTVKVKTLTEVVKVSNKNKVWYEFFA